jgi:hypothetical protein
MLKACLCVLVKKNPWSNSICLFSDDVPLPLRARGHVFTFPTSLLSSEMLLLAEDFPSVMLVSYQLYVRISYYLTQFTALHKTPSTESGCAQVSYVLRCVQSPTLYHDILTVTAPSYDQVEVSPIVTLD